MTDSLSGSVAAFLRFRKRADAAGCPTAVNPDCGLKTRSWPETLASLRNMVAAALALRESMGR